MSDTNSSQQSYPTTNDTSNNQGSDSNPYGTANSSNSASQNESTNSSYSSTPQNSSDSSSTTSSTSYSSSSSASSNNSDSYSAPSSSDSTSNTSINATTPITSNPDPVKSQEIQTDESHKKDDNTCLTNCDKKTEIPVIPDLPKKPMNFDGTFVLIFSALFIVLIQWLATTRRNSSIDPSKPCSIISGASLGYILVKGFPFVLGYLPEAATKIANLYLKDLSHLLLISCLTFSIGFIVNYTFEKRSARNIMEDVPHGPFLYGTNLLFLTIVNMFFGIHFITLYKTGGCCDLLLALLLLGGLNYIESVSLNHIYSGRSALFRQILLSSAIILGILIRKVSFIQFTPIMGILSYSFIMGYFMMSALRIEFALVKRTCHYQTFLISFASTVALILIYSLYASIKC